MLLFLIYAYTILHTFRLVGSATVDGFLYDIALGASAAGVFRTYRYCMHFYYIFLHVA